jgi:hypothetical protein
MSNPPDTALKILQLLLRCGMVCQEELNIVLDAMAAGAGAEPPAVAEARERGTER